MKSHKILIIKIFILALFCYKCNSQEENISIPINYIYGLDISKNDSSILYGYGNKINGTVLYSANIYTKLKEKIIDSGDSMIFYRPTFSKSNQMISFIAAKKSLSELSDIYTYDLRNKKLNKITNSSGLYSSITFSENDSLLLFCKAIENVKSSPIGVKMPHGMDIYQINIFNRNIKKLTNLNSYGINGYSYYSKDTLLVGIDGGEAGGLFLYDLKSNIKKRFIPVNNPRKDPSLYYKPNYCKEFKVLFFTSPYELYLMDFKDKMAFSVYKSLKQYGTPIEESCFLHNRKSVIFQIEGVNSFFIIDFDGKNFNEITIENN